LTYLSEKSISSVGFNLKGDKKIKMAKINDFEELEIWKSVRVSSKEVYLDFRENKDFGIKYNVAQFLL